MFPFVVTAGPSTAPKVVIRVSPAEEKLFQATDRIYALIEEMGYEALLERKESLLGLSEESKDAVLGRYGFAPLRTHGDVGGLLVLLVDVLDESGQNEKIVELKNIYTELDSSEESFQGDDALNLLLKWRRSRSISNSEFRRIQKLFK